MKETSRNLDAFSAKVKAAAGSNLRIYQANLQALPPTMEAGSNGFCGWMPIVAPELCAQVCDLTLPAELRKLAHDKLVAFNAVMVAHGFPASAKHILAGRACRSSPTAAPAPLANSSRSNHRPWTTTSRAPIPSLPSRYRKAPSQPMPPNIVVFFTDDHAGWALPSYGNSEISAPNLTHLAETGALMRNAFTPCPVCSPARASFWTGLYPSQHGVHDHLAEDDPAVQATNWLAGIPTLADHLREAGYTTALAGKWHCGAGEAPRSGFDFWYSGWRKTPKYFSLTSKYSDQGRVVERRGYDTQIFTDAAIDFLRERERERPFFLFIGYATTHNPWINRPNGSSRSTATRLSAIFPLTNPIPLAPRAPIRSPPIIRVRRWRNTTLRSR